MATKTNNLRRAKMAIRGTYAATADCVAAAMEATDRAYDAGDLQSGNALGAFMKKVDQARTTLRLALEKAGR